MKRAVAQIGDVALLAKPVAEASNDKRLAKLGDQEGQVPARGGVNDRPQGGMGIRAGFTQSPRRLGRVELAVPLDQAPSPSQYL